MKLRYVKQKPLLNQVLRVETGFFSMKNGSIKTYYVGLRNELIDKTPSRFWVNQTELDAAH